MAITKEERKAKRKERKSKLPLGGVGYDGLEIFLECGDSGITVTIERRIIEQFGYILHASVPSSSPLEYLEVPLLDLVELGEFIHALAARYNAMVDEANALATASGLKPLKTMPDTHIEEAQPMFT